MQHILHSFARLSTICEAAPIRGRVNEDTCSIFSDGKDITLLVADGYTQRVKLRKLQQLITVHKKHATAASYAAWLTQRTIASKILDGQRLSLQDLLLEANSALHSQLEDALGELTADALLQAEPHLHFLEEDPRLIRITLPACVATLARVDLTARLLEFAHAGDTSLFLFYEDGSVVQITDDQMEHHDVQALKLARTIQEEKGLISFSEALADERVIEMNRLNAIYHNYIDHRGNCDRNLGVGVIDGLPQLADYIQQDTIDLTNVRSLLICSDGLVWPAVWNESDAEFCTRLQAMRTRIELLNLAGYISELRNVERVDTACNLYPRFKTHDDATGIYLELF